MPMLVGTFFSRFFAESSLTCDCLWRLATVIVVQAVVGGSIGNIVQCL